MTRRSVTLGVLFLGSLLVGAGSSNAGEYYVLGLSHAEGSLGTFWKSDMIIKTDSAAGGCISFELLEFGETNSSPHSVAYPRCLDANETVKIEDVLMELFDYTGNATLRVTTDNDVTIISRTYNTGPDGTYGQFVPAFTLEEAFDGDRPAFLIGLRESKVRELGYRTNIGFQNLSNARNDLMIYLFNAAGDQIGVIDDSRYKPEAFEPNQVNRPLAPHVPAGDTDFVGFAVIVSETDAPFLAYASVVDNTTGDAILIPATTESSPPPITPPAAAGPVHVSTASGSYEWDFSTIRFRLFSGDLVDEFCIHYNATGESITVTRDDILRAYGQEGISDHSYCGSTQNYYIRFAIKDGYQTHGFSDVQTVRGRDLDTGDMMEVDFDDISVIQFPF